MYGILWWCRYIKLCRIKGKPCDTLYCCWIIWAIKSYNRFEFSTISRKTTEDRKKKVVKYNYFLKCIHILRYTYVKEYNSFPYTTFPSSACTCANRKKKISRFSVPGFVLLFFFLLHVCIFVWVNIFLCIPEIHIIIIMLWLIIYVHMYIYTIWMIYSFICLRYVVMHSIIVGTILE